MPGTLRTLGNKVSLNQNYPPVQDSSKHSPKVVDHPITGELFSLHRFSFKLQGGKDQLALRTSLVARNTRFH